MDTIKLMIDGKQVTAPEGVTVLRAAKDAGIDIPTLCAHDDLPDYGACRLCIVQIEGMRGFPTSCTTPAAEGMVVTTCNSEIDQLRSEIMELMMSGHPNACLVCNHREECEKYRPRVTKGGRATRCGVCSNRDGCVVRSMVLECNTRYLDLPTLYCHQNLERDDPFMERDLNLCVFCGKCWRICEKIHGKPAITITKRGRWAKVGTAFDVSYVDSGCTFCGACIDICPTGTLTDRYARWHGQASFGWESACTLCPEGCTLKVMAKDNRVTHTEMVRFDSEQRLCAIGRFGFTQVMNSTRRLLSPMTRDKQ
ncbi:MAG: (2Fe-2S)-binding protein, partial [Phycisphaerales bacterium]